MSAACVCTVVGMQIPGVPLSTGISFLAFRLLKIYTRLPQIEPSEHNVFSQMVPTGSQPPFPRPQELSARLPEPPFCDNSPFLGDSGTVFLECHSLRYPAGSDNAPIRPNILANSRRVRWPSASNSQ